MALRMSRTEWRRGLPPAFGPGSRERHERRADGAVVDEVPGLLLDVDTPEDLAALWAVVDESRRGAQRTRGALAQLDRSGVRAAIEGEVRRGRATVGA